MRLLVRARADEVLTRFDDASPLRRHGVVSLSTPGDVSSTMRTARIADRIVAFLRGHDTVDESVLGFVRIVRDPPPLDQVVMNPELMGQIARALDGGGRPVRVLLSGPEGSGRAMTVAALYGAGGRPVLRVDLAGIVADGRIAEKLGQSSLEVGDVSGWGWPRPRRPANSS